MSCVTPADLGKPIAAIVQRCGPPEGVRSIAGENSMMYAAAGQGVKISFDADQTRARIAYFFNYPPDPSQTHPQWSMMLPFASGAREVTFERLTLAGANAAFATDADVTTPFGAAFRSSPSEDVVLAFGSDERVLRGAWVGERTTLVQTGIIASALDAPPLEFMSPVPREDWLKEGAGGPHSTIVRIDIDAAGIVRKTTVVVPSGDSAFDDSLQARIDDVKFRPATLAQRPVSGSYFAQVRH